MDCHYEGKNRVSNQYFRRRMFAKQEELPGQLNKNGKSESIKNINQYGNCIPLTMVLIFEWIITSVLRNRL
jgi:hypothetical protein